MTVPVAANPAANRADGRLFVLALGMFAMGTGSFVVAGILPDVARTLGTSPSAAGLMVTVNALAFAVMAPIVAALAGGWPRKTLLVAALAIFVLGNAISALGTNLATVLIGRAVTGLGAAMFSPTALGIAATIVAPERRGRALAIVTAGLAGSTALGAPLGTLIGGLVGWRATLWFVAGIGFMTALGVGLLLRAVPQPPRIGLAARLAPLRHAGIGLTMLTTLFAFGGFLMVYTYSGLVFDRVTGGEKSLLAGLLLFWGVAAIIGNLVSGRLVDRHGSHRIIIGTLAVAIGNFLLLPWTSASLVLSALALILWGAAGWGLMVPQQHRLISASPEQAPLLLALNNSALHAGLVLASLAGAGALLVIDRHYLGWAGAASLAIALLLARAARTHLDRRSAATDGEAPQVLAPAE
jgi:MFS transporter, DHA1 family, inner membrane transport protein